MEWWLWAALGLVLAGMELFAPGGFFIMFFGVGALATALTVALVDLSAVWQWLLFTAVSVISLMVFRRRLLDRMRARSRYAPVDSLMNEMAVAIEDIEPGAMGQVELRGSGWKAKNVGATPVITGQRCHVDRVDGLMLWIRAEGETP